MGRPAGWMTALRGRSPMKSPGAPSHRREVEREFYRKTGIFPIMHTLVMQEKLYEQRPWVAESLFKAFEEAHDPFDPATAHRLYKYIYSSGGTRDFAAAYRAFRGRDPRVEALLEGRGLHAPVAA